MTTLVRESQQSFMWKSLAGMGVSFGHKDEQTLWDTSLPEDVYSYLIVCPYYEFEAFCKAVCGQDRDYALRQIKLSMTPLPF